MSRRIYRDVAEMLHNASKADLRTPAEVLVYIRAYMIAVFEGDNPRFDAERFRAWCENGTDKGTN